MSTVQHTIESKLSSALKPIHLQVENESYKHNVPEGAESHFKVTIVTEAFDGQRLLQRHRLVNQTLKAEIERIHALSLHTFTPPEWTARGEQAAETPPCLGGDRN